MTVKNESNIFVRSEKRTLANSVMNFSKYLGVGSLTMISAFIMAGSPAIKVRQAGFSLFSKFGAAVETVVAVNPCFF